MVLRLIQAFLKASDILSRRAAVATPPRSMSGGEGGGDEGGAGGVEGEPKLEQNANVMGIQKNNPCVTHTFM